MPPYWAWLAWRNPFHQTWTPLTCGNLCRVSVRSSHHERRSFSTWIRIPFGTHGRLLSCKSLEGIEPNYLIIIFRWKKYKFIWGQSILLKQHVRESKKNIKEWFNFCHNLLPRERRKTTTRNCITWKRIPWKKTTWYKEQCQSVI